jgi:hypothetical protein
MNYWHILRNAVIFIIAFFLIDFLISSFLTKGLFKFYGFEMQPKILINGSSISYYGFNRNYIEINSGQNVSPYVRGGVGIEDRYYMIQHFLSNYSNNLKTVFYEINPTLFSGVAISKNVHKLFLPFIDQKSFMNYFKERMDLKSYYFYKLIKTSRFNDYQLKINSFRGYLKRYDNWQQDVIDTSKIEDLKKSKDSVVIEIRIENIEIFLKTMKLLTNQNAKVYLLMMPMYSPKLETYQTESYNSFCNYFKTFCQSSPKTFFIDLNSIDSLTDYNGFFDPIHLNSRGQKDLSKILVDILNDKLIMCQE